MTSTVSRWRKMALKSQRRLSQGGAKTPAQQVEEQRDRLFRQLVLKHSK